MLVDDAHRHVLVADRVERGAERVVAHVAERAAGPVDVVEGVAELEVRCTSAMLKVPDRSNVLSRMLNCSVELPVFSGAASKRTYCVPSNSGVRFL